MTNAKTVLTTPTGEETGGSRFQPAPLWRVLSGPLDPNPGRKRGATPLRTTTKNSDGSYSCADEGPNGCLLIAEGKTPGEAIRNFSEEYARQYAEAESLTALTLEITGD